MQYLEMPVQLGETKLQNKVLFPFIEWWKPVYFSGIYALGQDNYGVWRSITQEDMLNPNWSYYTN